MNVDIKNALDKLLLACDHIQAVAPENNDAKNIRNLVVADIFGFIDTISLAKADERKNIFANTYLDGTVYSEPTGALPLLCQVDNSASSLQGAKTTALYISFLFELGRYYTLSKHDKRDIDVTKFAMHIKQLNDFVSAHSIAVSQKQGHVATEDGRKEAAVKDDAEIIAVNSPQEVEQEESLEELLD